LQRSSPTNKRYTKSLTNIDDYNCTAQLRSSKQNLITE